MLHFRKHHWIAAQSKNVLLVVTLPEDIPSSICGIFKIFFKNSTNFND